MQLCARHFSLQVLPVNGTYTPARPIPGTVLVNIGDLMQRWTADKLISTVSKNLLAKDCLLESNVDSLLSSAHLTQKVMHPWLFDEIINNQS